MLAGMAVLIWLMRFRRWKSWSLIFVVFISAILISFYFFNEPMELDDSEVAIISPILAYFGIAALFVVVCLIFSAVSLLLDGNSTVEAKSDAP